MPHDENGTQIFTKREIFGLGAGKGDMRRGRQISEKEYAANWARVFGKPARPGRKRPVCGPIQWQPCPKCGRVTSFEACAACGELLTPHTKLNAVATTGCQINLETKS